MRMFRDDEPDPASVVSSFRLNKTANGHARIASMKKRIGAFWLDKLLPGE